MRTRLTRVSQHLSDGSTPLRSQSRLSEVILLISPEALDVPAYVLSLDTPRLVDLHWLPLSLISAIPDPFSRSSIFLEPIIHIHLLRHVIPQSTNPLSGGRKLRGWKPRTSPGRIWEQLCGLPYAPDGIAYKNLSGLEARVWPEGCLRSTGDPHTAHAVTEAVDPETGHVVFLDLHGVAFEVGTFKQADLVLLGVLEKERLGRACEV